ncbi:MAG: hypothetical protein ACOWWH_11205 [Eubacteriaceae bacterium]
MKKVIIILSIILICILFIGFNFINKSTYNQNQIEEINNVIKSNMKNITSLNTDNIDDVSNEISDQNSENSKDEETNDKPPKIDILYPSSFDDGDTIETKRVQLALSDDSKVVKATMNEISVDTKEIFITTEGTYNISVIDDSGNETTLSFTIIFPKKTTSKNTSNSSNSENNASEKDEEPTDEEPTDEEPTDVNP